MRVGRRRIRDGALVRAITGGVTFGPHDVPFPEVAAEWLMNIELDPVRVLLRRPRVIVDFTTPLRDVAATLNEELVGAALVRRTVVIDGAVTHPEGIVSERDISRAVAAGLDLDTTHAGDVMAVDLASARADDTTLRVAARMLANGVRHMPIMDGDAVIGVVSERDVLGALLQEVQDLRSSSQ
jgi:CBS domain-containing protein